MIGVAGRGLVGGLALVLGADGVLGRRASRREAPPPPGRGARRRAGRTRASAAGAARRRRCEAAREAAREGRRRASRSSAASASRRAARPARIPAARILRFSRSASLSMLGHAQSSPIVSGATVWIGEDEAREPLRVEPPVAVPDQLQRHRVDARLARELARGELGELLVVAGREVVAHGARLRLDEVEVVEEPLGRGVDGVTPADVVGQDAVGLAKDPEVRVQPRPDVVPARPGVARQREDAGQGLRALLEALEAQELAPERHFLFGTAPSEQGSHQAGRLLQPLSPSLSRRADPSCPCPCCPFPSSGLVPWPWAARPSAPRLPASASAALALRAARFCALRASSLCCCRLLQLASGFGLLLLLCERRAAASASCALRASSLLLLPAPSRASSSSPCCCFTRAASASCALRASSPCCCFTRAAASASCCCLRAVEPRCCCCCFLRAASASLCLAGVELLLLRRRWQLRPLAPCGVSSCCCAASRAASARRRLATRLTRRDLARHGHGRRTSTLRVLRCEGDPARLDDDGACGPDGPGDRRKACRLRGAPRARRGSRG